MTKNQSCVLFALTICEVLPLFRQNQSACENTQGVQGLPFLIFLIKYFACYCLCVKIPLLTTLLTFNTFYSFKIIRCNSAFRKHICIFMEEK